VDDRVRGGGSGINKMSTNAKYLLFTSKRLRAIRSLNGRRWTVGSPESKFQIRRL